MRKLREIAAALHEFWRKPLIASKPEFVERVDPLTLEVYKLVKDERMKRVEPVVKQAKTLISSANGDICRVTIIVQHADNTAIISTLKLGSKDSDAA